MERKSLYFARPRAVEVREERVGLPGDGEVLVRTVLSGISAGTEMLFYRDQLEAGIPLDAKISSLAGSFDYPFKYGYATVGEVIDRGSGVPSELEGRLVFSFHPHESHFTIPPGDLVIVPEGLSAEDAVFLPSMETAVSLVMDGGPVIGEDVMVIGQGVIGLLTTALLARSPLSSLSTLERYPLRQRMSLEMGSGRCLDGTGPPSELLRDCGLGPRRADLTYELSGNPEALNLAMKLTGFEGRVVLGSWYGNKAAILRFGEDFHRNRLRIISSQVSSIGPLLSGRWDKRRRLDLAWRMIKGVRPSRLITHRFDISAAPEAYGLLDSNGQDALQVVLTYGG